MCDEGLAKTFRSPPKIKKVPLSGCISGAHAQIAGRGCDGGTYGGALRKGVQGVRRKADERGAEAATGRRFAVKVHSALAERRGRALLCQRWVCRDVVSVCFPDHAAQPRSYRHTRGTFRRG